MRPPSLAPIDNERQNCENCVKISPPELLISKLVSSFARLCSPPISAPKNSAVARCDDTKTKHIATERATRRDEAIEKSKQTRNAICLTSIETFFKLANMAKSGNSLAMNIYVAAMWNYVSRCRFPHVEGTIEEVVYEVNFRVKS
jgi:hypothetical protein